MSAALNLPGPGTALPSPRPPVVVENLSCRLGGREVLKGIDLSIARGTVLGILGANGSGKSTLLRCIAGLARPAAGRVKIEGEDVASLPPARLARRLALQAQDAEAALGFSVREVVAMGRLAHRVSPFGSRSKGDDVVVARCLDALELTALSGRRMEALSGGERQRVMIARALAQEPTVLLLDEPTNHLDVQHRFAVLDLVRELGITVVATLHDIELAARTCDRLVLLKGGAVVADGTPFEALTANSIASVYGVSGEIDRQPGTGKIRVDLQPTGRGRLH
jgi:iron complex transport system ATP-binding protein